MAVLPPCTARVRVRLSPRSRSFSRHSFVIIQLAERLDPRREMQDDVGDRVGDRGSVEEVELVSTGCADLMARLRGKRHEALSPARRSRRKRTAAFSSPSTIGRGEATSAPSRAGGSSLRCSCPFLLGEARLIRASNRRAALRQRPLAQLPGRAGGRVVDLGLVVGAIDDPASRLQAGRSRA